ncbi:LPXTG cell wall anchor domain-containing protein [Staphylococcus petrasii]|uniref:LPXTG cell wall anchor domain-containing protein n=1 Tax=Staphylococcus petrasii TaxID=1276936 RepID=UPI001F5A706F|nr:LPXTG cell wall anchor domain-containing protein [Staphylococcus petrasii]MCI2775029.1 LPXTG cell wall anchor domain-containing protein [Staphylococcus petrasii]
MKKSSIFATTTLAGALLFSGVGAHQAHAADQVTKSQAEESVRNFVTNNSNYHPYNDTKYIEWHMDGVENPIENSYQIIFGENPNQSPTSLFVKKDTGDIYNWDGQLVKKGAVNTNQNDQQTTNNTTQNNTQVATQITKKTNDNKAQTTTSSNNTSTQVTNNQSNEQQTTNALPETGEQSNSGLVTIIASVLLAAGSLLTFKRFSNNKYTSL